MSSKVHTSTRVKHALPRVLFSAPVALRFLLVLAISLFTCATPSIGQRELVESEAPLQEEHSNEEAAVSERALAGFPQNQLGFRLLVPLQNSQSRLARVDNSPKSGHRLSNHLMAPLRC